MVNSEDYKALKERERQNLHDMMEEGKTSIRFTSEPSLNDEEEQDSDNSTFNSFTNKVNNDNTF